MREVSVESLRDEILQLRGAVTLTRIYHASGVKLHPSGSPLTMAEIQAMVKAGLGSVFFADQGEGDLEAQRALTTEVVEVRDLAVGDLLADTILDGAGETVCGPGTFVDEILLSGRIREGSGPVTVRRRGLRGPEAATEYLGLIPRYPPHPPRPDSTLSRLGDSPARGVRPLLAPRARVMVAVEDGFQRALMLNVCAVEGHEVIDRRWAEAVQANLERPGPDAIILDLAQAPAALPVVRRSPQAGTVAVLVTAPEGRRSEVYKAIVAGANGSVPLPVKRDGLLEKLHSTLQALGRRTRLKPAVAAERRSLPREGAHLLCTLQDKFLSSPLPVKEATLLDVSDQGFRIEYRRPAGSATHAYLAHGVHPQHVFFNYARDNPLGRDVSVTFPSAAGRTLEGHAKFVHVSTSGDFETAGLVLGRMKSSVREHMTAVRGGALPVPVLAPIRPSPSSRRTF